MHSHTHAALLGPYSDMRVFNLFKHIAVNSPASTQIAALQAFVDLCKKHWMLFVSLNSEHGPCLHPLLRLVGRNLHA